MVVNYWECDGYGLTSNPWYFMVYMAWDLDLPDNSYVIRSRGRHDPGDGDYDYYSYRAAPGRLQSYDGKAIALPPGGSYLFEWEDLDASRKHLRWECFTTETTYERFISVWNPRRRYWQVYYQKSWLDNHEIPTTYHYVTKSGNLNGYEPFHFTDEDVRPSNEVIRMWVWENPYTPAPKGQTGTKSSLASVYIDGTVPSSERPAATSLRDSILYTHSTGLQNALAIVYRDALAGLPHTTMNNIQNVLDIVGALKTFVGGHLDLPKGLPGLKETLTSGWMGYRYAYGTTKMDIIDGVELVDRLQNVSKDDTITTNAVYRVSEGNAKFVFRCSVKLYSSELSEVSTFAEKWGFALTPYAMWDMVPYSFIVDWFLDIGGLLEYYQGYNYACRFKPIEIWYSVSKTVEHPDGSSEDWYYRWRGDPPSAIPTYTSYGASGVTLLKRAADLVAMLL